MSDVYVAASSIAGKGIFGGRAFRADERILRIDDSRVVDDNHPLDPSRGEDEEHLDYLPDNTMVAMQAPEKFLNHSCEPNTYIRTEQDGRYLLAMRDAQAGEELLFDYALNAIGGMDWECCCGAPACRGLHPCDFFALPVSVQRRYVPYLDPWFVRVHGARIAECVGDEKMGG